jgi:hypothetical protein
MDEDKTLDAKTIDAGPATTPAPDAKSLADRGLSPTVAAAPLPNPPKATSGASVVAVQPTAFQPTAPDYPEGFVPPVPTPPLRDPNAIEDFLNEFAPNPVTRRHMERRLRETVEHFGGRVDG